MGGTLEGRTLLDIVNGRGCGKTSETEKCPRHDEDGRRMRPSRDQSTYQHVTQTRFPSSEIERAGFHADLA